MHRASYTMNNPPSSPPSGVKDEKKAVAGGDFNPEFQKGGKEEYRS